MAEGEGTSWTDTISDEGHRELLSKFESEDQVLEALGLQIHEAGKGGNGELDWRTGLPDELKETADRFSSVNEAIIAVQDLRKRESQVRVPGDKATDEELKSYYKAVGVPEKVEGYEFPALPQAPPEGSDDDELRQHKILIDGVNASRKQWADRFHELKVPKDTALKLTNWLNEDIATQFNVQEATDLAFAKSQEDELALEWKGDDFKLNKTFANRGFNELANRAGLDATEIGKIQTKDGKLLMDHAPIVRLFAIVGREMGEGTLGPSLTEAEVVTMDEKIIELRKQTATAKAEGNTTLANSLYQQTLALIEKKQGGPQPIVGSGARTV